MTTDESLIYEISIAQKDLDKQLKGVQKSFDKTFDKIDKKASGATDVFKGMIGAEAVKKGMTIAVDAVKEGIKKIVSETSQLEDATLDWEMLTGSAEEAGRRIASVYSFANKTPFDTKEVNIAATNLYKVSQGALGAESDLIRLGDAAKKGNIPIVELSTTYGRLYSKMANGEKAFGDEINRMTDLGLVTFKTKQALQDMDASLLKTEGLKLLNKDLDAANGTMERFSKTIGGKLGTLSSTWDQIFAFDDKEVTEGIGKSIQTLTDTLEKNKPAIQSILTDTFSVVISFVEEWINGALIIKGMFSRDDSYNKYKIDSQISSNQTKSQVSTYNSVDKLAKTINDNEKARVNDNAETKTWREQASKSSNIALSYSITDGFKKYWNSSVIEKAIIPLAFKNFVSGSVNSYSITGNESLEQLMGIKETINEGNLSLGSDFEKLLDNGINILQQSETNIKNAEIYQNRLEQLIPKTGTGTTTSGTGTTTTETKEKEKNFEVDIDWLSIGRIFGDNLDKVGKQEFINLAKNQSSIMSDSKITTDEMKSLITRVSNDVNRSKSFTFKDYKEADPGRPGVKSIEYDKLIRNGITIDSKTEDSLNKLESSFSNFSNWYDTNWGKDTNIDNKKLSDFNKSKEEYNKLINNIDSKVIPTEAVIIQKADTGIAASEGKWVDRVITEFEGKLKGDINRSGSTLGSNTYEGVIDENSMNMFTKKSSTYEGVIDENSMNMFTKKSLNSKDKLGGLTTIANSMATFVTNSDAIFDAWSKNSLKSFGNMGQAITTMSSGLIEGIGGITGTDTGNLIPGLGLATAGFGIISAIAGIGDSNSDEDEGIDENISIGDTATTQRATIVSSGAGDVYNTNTFNFDGCFVDEVAMSEWIEKDVIPKLDNITAGVN